LGILACLIACWAHPCPVSALQVSEAEEYEKNIVNRLASRLARAQRTDHARWSKELAKAFPGRVSDPASEEGYGQWFDLLSGKGDRWRRPLGPTNPLAKLFRELADDRRLGPVPSISREEFMRYASRELYRDHRRARQSLPKSDEEADKVFRVLDADGDGVLARTELTTELRSEKADTSGNGRVERDEYRHYLERRVLAAVPAAIAKAEKDDEDDDDDDRDRPTKPPEKSDEEELPDWFVELDFDRDDQVALFEWRRAGGEIQYFTEMDLDEDGLLTQDEYFRFIRTLEKTNQQEPPPGGPVPKKKR
jgi:Ca2+-binding EF-hand superfamily protein